MDKKRIVFANEERAMVRQLVFERKDVIENKKSDVVALAKKKQAWEEITEIFNSRGSFPIRSTAQLKKLWENAKSRRRAQLALEKGEVMRTQSIAIKEDPELDSLLAGLASHDVQEDGDDPQMIEAQVVISTSSIYDRVGEVPSTAQQEEQCSPIPLDQLPVQTPLYKKESETEFTSTDGIASRSRMKVQFDAQNKGLHALRLSELQKKNKLLELQILHEEELFKMKKETQELKRRKLMLEIRNLEGDY